MQIDPFRSRSIASSFGLRVVAAATATVVLSWPTPAMANTPHDVIGIDLSQAVSYAPASLPTDVDDVRLNATATAATTYFLPGLAGVTIGSLNNASPYAATVTNNQPGVATVTLGGPGTTGNVTPGASASDLIYAAENLTIAPMSNTGGVGLIDLSLGRAGTFTAAASKTLLISTPITTNGYTLTCGGAGAIRLITPSAVSFSSTSNGRNGLAGFTGISGSGGLTVATTGYGYVAMDGINTYTGATVIAPGSNFGLGGSIDNSSAIINNGIFEYSTHGFSTLRQPVSGSGRFEVVSFPSLSTVITNAASSYTGSTTVTAGILVATKLANGGEASSIGASSNSASNLILGKFGWGSYTELEGATLRYIGPAVSTDRLLTSECTYAPGRSEPSGITSLVEASGTGALTFSNTGHVAYDTANAARTVSLGGINTDINTFTPAINDNGTGTVSFAKNGAGTWKLAGTNAYTGGTVIYDGLLIAANPTAIGGIGQTVYLNDRASIGTDFALNQTFLSRLYGTGAVVLSADNSTNLNFNSTGSLMLGAAAGTNVTYSGRATFGGNPYRFGGGGGTLTYSSTITGALSVNVGNASTPAGSLTILTGANTYTGTNIVRGGILKAGNASATGTGTINVGTNGTYVPFGAADQTLVNRFSGMASTGSLAVTGDNAASLNFSSAGSLKLGAFGNATFTGTLTPASTYLLGGGGGTLNFNSDLIKPNSGLSVGGNGLTSTQVVLNGSNTFTGSVSIKDATLVLGPTSPLPAGNSLSLGGVSSTLDLGGHDLSVSSLSVVPDDYYSRTAVRMENGNVNIASGTTSIRPTVFNPSTIDLSGLSSLTYGSTSAPASGLTLGFNGFANASTGIYADAPNSIKLAANTQIASISNFFGGTADTVFDLGAVNTTLRISTLLIGNGSAKTTVQFPTGAVNPSLVLRGTNGTAAASTLALSNSAFATTTLDLSGGTTNAMIDTVYVGRIDGATAGTDSTAILTLGGADTVFNVGQLYVNFSLNSANGIAIDTFNQTAGTVVAGAVRLMDAPATLTKVFNTVLAEYDLGTAATAATLSTGGVSIGRTAVTSKSRATLRFYNGRIEPLDPARTNGVLAGGGPGVTSVVKISGIAGGGTAIDSKTLNIVLAATGTHTFAAQPGRTLQVESTALVTGPGGLTVEGGGTVAFDGANSYAGLTTIIEGTLALTVAAQSPIVSGGGADIRGGRVVFDYNGGPNPVNTIRSLLAASHAAGFTTGQIHSSTTDARYALGFKDDSAAMAVTVAYTLNGDADLDGAVDINDFNALASHFGQASGNVWIDGDFDYDGGVTIDDFNLLAANFGHTLANSPSMSGADYNTLLAFATRHGDVAAFAAAMGIPEPPIAVLIAGAFIGVRRTRLATARRR